jgi:hypothetical protein
MLYAYDVIWDWLRGKGITDEQYDLFHQAGESFDAVIRKTAEECQISEEDPE